MMPSSSSGSHFPPRHNDSVKNIMAAQQQPALEEIKRYEDLLVDSQRKLSAPVNQHHQRLSEGMQEQAHIDGQNARYVGGMMMSERREILTITVDIGSADGETANIVIRDGDNPLTLAEEFA
jgi:hypothetical protein